MAYEAALKAANVPNEGHIYPGAVHGFNNDATPEHYNKAAADQAWLCRGGCVQAGVPGRARGGRVRE